MSLREAQKKYGWLIKEMNVQGLSKTDKAFVVAEMWCDELQRALLWGKSVEEYLREQIRLFNEFSESEKKIVEHRKVSHKRNIPKVLLDAEDKLVKEYADAKLMEHYCELRLKRINKKVELLEALLIHYFPKAATMLGKAAVETTKTGKTRITIPKGTKKVKVKL